MVQRTLLYLSRLAFILDKNNPQTYRNSCRIHLPNCENWYWLHGTVTTENQSFVFIRLECLLKWRNPIPATIVTTSLQTGCVPPVQGNLSIGKWPIITRFHFSSWSSCHFGFWKSESRYGERPPHWFYAFSMLRSSYENSILVDRFTNS